jgi:hypothetical protein
MFRWKTSVSAQLALTVPLLAPALPSRAEAPPAGPLDAHVVDASSYPTVLLDVVIPWQHRTADVDAGMIELEGGTVDSVAPVQAVGTVVGLVIDDGPTVKPPVLNDAQGASVDLVRNLGNGTAIALSTPSGMQTTPTTDRGASIARIAGITAGAPDVVPLPRLVLDAATRLASGAWPDRHLVLVLGRPLTMAPTLRELTDITVAGDVRVHVVADPRIDAGGVKGVAERTGGVAGGDGTMLAEVDAVTAAIAHRMRVTATVTEPGRHEITLTVDGARFSTGVDVPAPAVPPTPTTASVDDTVAPQVAPAPAESGPPASVAASSEAVPPRPMWIAVALIAFGVTALAWLWISARRRRPTRAAEPAPAPEPASAAPVPAPAVEGPVPGMAARPRRGPPAPALEPLAEPVAATGGPSAPTAPRRPTARPRRATPPRRPPTSAPPGELAEPAEAEPVEPDVGDEWLVVGRVRLSRRTGDVYSGTRRISLTPAQFAVLELLMTRGGHGVTRDAIRAAITGSNGSQTPELDDVEDLDAFLAELRRKTGIRGRGQGVRQERANVYFFGE